MNAHDADTNLRNQLQWPVFLRHRNATHLTRPPHEAQGSAGVRPWACLGAKRAGKIFEVFNDRLAIVKFSDSGVIGYDPLELLLPTDIDDKGIAYFEIRPCRLC